MAGNRQDPVIAPPRAIMVFYLLLLVGGIEAMLWHADNLRISELNHKKLRVGWHGSAQQSRGEIKPIRPGVWPPVN